MSKPKLAFIKVVDDLSDPDADKGKVAWIQRLKVQNHHEDGSTSREYRVDVISHKGYDAVGVIPYWYEGETVHLYLLNSFRPAITFRKTDPAKEPYLVEVIAGVIEAGENGDAGVKLRAVEELKEEAGLIVDESAVEILGAPFYTSPGVYTEKIWVCAAKIDPKNRIEPTLDGSVMEEMITPFTLTLDEALTKINMGEIRDAKTEIALMRLARQLGQIG